MRPVRSAALLAMLAAPSCGGEEPARQQPRTAPAPPASDPLFAVRGRWDEPRAITWRAEPDGGPVDPAEFERAVARAVEAWNATGAVRLVPAADGGEADVTLGWRRGHHGACEPFGATTAVAHSGPVGPGSFVHFDAAREWREVGGHSVHRTALHELGHVLGLGHSGHPDAAMSTGNVVPDVLGRADLCGIRSLYGGGEDAPGDLRIVGPDGGVRATLRGVAPPDRTAWAVFDTDGDGAAELLVWRTDRGGHGALMLYSFGPGSLLVGTSGPHFGATAAPDAEVLFARTDDGERLMLNVFGGDRTIARRFDDHGQLTPFLDAIEPAVVGRARAATRDAGDLDGDGTPERVVPVAG